MSYEAVDKVIRSDIGDATLFSVLLALAFFKNDRTGECFPSTDRIATTARRSPNVVRSAIKRLEQLGYLETKQVPGLRRFFVIHLERLPSKVEPLSDSEPLSDCHPLTEVKPLSEVTGDPCQKCEGTPFRSVRGPLSEVTPEQGIEQGKEQVIEQGSMSPLARASDDHAPTAAVDGELFPELEDYGPRMRCEPEKVRQLYNQILPELPECQILSKTRKTHIEARFRQLAKEEGFTTSKEVLDGFRIFFEGVKRSDFLMGRKDPGIGRTRAFRADLDWLMKESNFIKVCEGKYMNSNS